MNMLNVNPEEYRAAANAYTEAFCKLLEEYQSEENTDRTWIEVPIDKDHNLVWMRSAIVGEVVAITDKEYLPVFYYTGDDNVTPGDVNGGYLDIYFPGLYED